MVPEVDFSDLDASTEWFDAQSIEMLCSMASRAALRVLANVSLSKGAHRKTLALLSMWAILTSAGRGLWRPADVDALEAAADSAARSAHTAGTVGSWAAGSYARSAVDSAARTSALSTRTAVLSTRTAALSAVSKDSRLPWDAMLAEPVWGDMEVPEAIAQNHANFLTYLDSDLDWAFFRRWYAQMWDGTFEDWDLAIEVATLDPALWEGEDALAKVAEAIRGIEARLKTRVGPSLVRNDAGKWDIEDDVILPAEPLAFAIGQVEIALEAALAKQGNNVFSEDASEAQMISIALSRHRDHHSVVATSFWNACMGLERNIGDLYPEDSSLISMRNVLYTSVEEMCAQDDLVRDRIARLAALETRRYPTPDEIEQLKTVPEVVSEDMTERANAKLADAIEVVTTTEKPPRLWRARLVNWITTLGRGIEQGQKAEKKAAWLLKLGRSIAGWFFDEDDGED